MGRAPCCDKTGLKKGPWTAEEDQKLIDYIQLHGPGNWRNLPKNAGLQRCGKSCRLRWTNYLRPDIKRGRFSFEEEETIIQLHSILGNKWSAIAARLPGRTDNEIKNYWNTHIRKRLLRSGIDPVTHARRLDLLDLSSLLNAALCNPSILNLPNLLGTQASLMNPELLRLAALLLSVKQDNPDQTLLPHLQQNQLQNLIQLSQLANQFQTSDVSTANCTTSGAPCAPLSNQAQPIQAKTGIYQGFSADDVMANFGCQNAQDGFLASNVGGDFASQPCCDGTFLPENFSLDSTLPPLSENFGFDSLMSTPTSSPTPLNSSSTFVNGSSTEDERESNCSSLFKFEIPESLNFDDFM